MTRILVTSKFYNPDTGVLLQPKIAYETDGTYRVVPSFLEYSDAMLCYKVLVANDTVYVPVGECVVYDGKMPLKTIEESIAGMYDNTADALQAYEDAFGITKEMIYTPDIDGVIVVRDEVEKRETSEEETNSEDVSDRPFVY